MAALTGFLSPAQQLEELRKQALAQRMGPIAQGGQAFAQSPDLAGRFAGLGQQIGGGLAALATSPSNEELKQDPAYQQAAFRSNLMQNTDLTDRESVLRAAKQASEFGDTGLQMYMADRWMNMQPEAEDIYSDPYEHPEVPGVWVRKNLSNNKTEMLFKDPRVTGGDGVDKIDIPAEVSKENLETTMAIIDEEGATLEKALKLPEGTFTDLDSNPRKRFARDVPARAQELQALAKAHKTSKGGKGSIDINSAIRTAIREKASTIKMGPQFDLPVIGEVGTEPRYQPEEEKDSGFRIVK